MGDAAVDEQGLAVDHEHMAQIARKSRVRIGVAGHQGVGIAAGAVGIVAELDATEITLVAPPRSASGLGRCPFLALLGNPKPSPEPDVGGGGSC